MKTSELVRAANQISGGIGRSDKNNYDKCLLTIKDGMCQLKTLSDVIESVSERFNVEGDDNLILLEYAKFKQILSSLSRRNIESVKITEHKAKLTINGGRSNYEVGTFNPKDFPAEFKFKAVAKAVVERELFQRLLASAKQASAINDVRYFLNGVLFEVNTDVNDLRLVGTDGHRMNVCLMPMVSFDTSKSIAKQGFIIHDKMTDELLNFAKTQTEESLTIHFDDSHVHLEGMNGRSVTGRLIDGRYPDYRRVIPEKTNHSVVIDREDLQVFLSSATPLQGTRFPVGKFYFKGSELKVSIQGDETMADAIFDIEGYNNTEEFVIGYNLKYIGDVLAGQDSEQIHLMLTDSMASTKIVNIENPNVLSLVMPVRI